MSGDSSLGRDRTLALGGVFQAAVLTQQLAREGEPDEAAFAASVRSILITDAVDTASVFGGDAGVSLGLQALRSKLARRGGALDLEVARYVVSLVHLERVLQRTPAVQRTVAQRLARLQESGDAEHLGAGLCAALAGVYRDTISELAPKIIVHGEQGHLSDAAVVDRVRTALFAGIRAAHLWGQLGGRRWQLMLQRRAYIASARELLERLGARDHDPGRLE